MLDKNHWNNLKPDQLYLIPLGIGNAFTTRFYNSSLLVMVNGKIVLIDAPAPLGRVLRDTAKKSSIPIEMSHIDSLVLTHLHADHCNATEEIGFWRRYLCEGPLVRLYLLEELIKPFWDKRLALSMGSDLNSTKDPETNIHSYFDVAGLTPGEKYDLGIEGLVMECQMTVHFLPTVALKFTFEDQVLGYSADTRFEQSVIDFLAPSDFIIHETGEGSGHTDINDLLALDESIKKKIHLTHLADHFDIPNSPLAVLEEGKVYPIGETP